jgi:hypothetical protein
MLAEPLINSSFDQVHDKEKVEDQNEEKYMKLHRLIYTVAVYPKSRTGRHEKRD